MFVSVGAYYYIVNQPVTKKAVPDIVDAVGTKAVSSDMTLSTVKFTLRNSGQASLDLSKVALSWQGPKVQTILYLDRSGYAFASEDNFAVGGSGNPKDGWDPNNGKFLVKGDTLAWLVVNLTSSGGIGDPVGPGQTFTVKLTLDDHGDSTRETAEKSFKCPSSLGSGLFVSLASV